MSDPSEVPRIGGIFLVIEGSPIFSSNKVFNVIDLRSYYASLGWGIQNWSQIWNRTKSWRRPNEVPTCNHGQSSCRWYLVISVHRVCFMDPHPIVEIGPIIFSKPATFFSFLCCLFLLRYHFSFTLPLSRPYWPDLSSRQKCRHTHICSASAPESSSFCSDQTHMFSTRISLTPNASILWQQRFCSLSSLCSYTLSRNSRYLYLQTYHLDWPWTLSLGQTGYLWHR